MSVQKIINACVNGDTAAWDEFISIVQPVISGVGKKYVVKDIEDFSQNVYVQLISKDFALLKRYHGTDSHTLLTYIKSIAWRVAKNQSRKNKVLDLRQTVLEAGLHLAAKGEEYDLKITLNDAMMTLSLEEREIIVLQSSGYKFREIADFLRKPLGTIISKSSRAQKKLKTWVSMQ